MNAPEATHESPKPRWTRVAALVAGPIAALATHALLAFPESAPAVEARWAAGVLVWMAVWWITEAVPLPVTSLLPLVLLPLLGISSARDAAAPYADRVIFLFLGGFLLALGMERWNLHQRIALTILRFVGARPPRLVGGVMLATGLLSMWVSNTAAVLMMLPIVGAIIHLVETQTGRRSDRLALCCLLGVAYAASIGGMATPIGSPPNAIAIGFLDRQYGLKVDFLHWSILAAPISALLLVITWAYLTRLLFPLERDEIPGGRALIARRLSDLGPMTRGERSIMTIFFLTVAGWMLREPLFRIVPPLGDLLRDRIDDTTVALFGALLLFIVPVDLPRRVFVLDWRATVNVPWGVLLLFGGGLSLAGAVDRSGLAAYIGSLAGAMAGAPTVLIVILCVAIASFGSEVMSNTAQANLYLPILGAVAVSMAIDPVLLTLSCVLGLSLAFMLPMGTPPNALVFSTGRVTIRQMALAGLGLNFISIALIVAASYTIVPLVFGKAAAAVQAESLQAVP